MATLTLGLVFAGHGSRGWGCGVYRGFGEYCAIVLSLLSPPPAAAPSQASQLGVEPILKWADFGGLCIEGGHMPRGLDVHFGSRNLFRVLVRPAPDLGLWPSPSP